MDMKERLAKIMAQKRGVTPEILEKNNEVINQIKESETKNNTVAIIESHKKHAEVYPSVIKYFLDLGYNVHLFHLEEHVELDSLKNCNYPKEKFQTFAFVKMPETQEFFDLLNNYTLIFVATMFTHDGYNFLNALEENYIKKYSKENVFCIDHDFTSIQKGIQTIEQRFLDKNKVFVLRDNIKYHNKNLPFISPIYLGEYKLEKHILNNKKEFLCVGGSLQNNLRNLDLLFKSIGKLIDNGVKNFKVIFVGTTEKNLENWLTDINRPFIDIRGFLPFDEMNKTIINSDFLMYNTDNTVNEYSKYLTLGITGSYSLNIAFIKPALVYEELAKAYELDDCSILYTADLYSAMKKAIELSQSEYDIMQEKLIAKNQKLQQQSRENLKNVCSLEKV